MSQIKQQGFSLIELMISMVLGLAVIAGIGTVAVSAKSASNYQQKTIEIQEKLTVVGTLVRSLLKQSGYIAMENNKVLSKESVFSPDKTFPGHGQFLSGTETIKNIKIGIEKGKTKMIQTHQDSLAFRFEGDAEVYDCNAEETNKGTIYTSTLYINNKGQLICAHKKGESILMGSRNGVNGTKVISFKVTYGVDLQGNGDVGSYKGANAMQSSDWGKVKALDIEIILHANNERAYTTNHFIYLPNATGV